MLAEDAAPGLGHRVSHWRVALETRLDAIVGRQDGGTSASRLRHSSSSRRYRFTVVCVSPTGSARSFTEPDLHPSLREVSFKFGKAVLVTMSAKKFVLAAMLAQGLFLDDALAAGTVPIVAKTHVSPIEARGIYAGPTVPGRTIESYHGFVTGAATGFGGQVVPFTANALDIQDVTMAALNQLWNNAEGTGVWAKDRAVIDVRWQVSTNLILARDSKPESVNQMHITVLATGTVVKLKAL